MSQEQGAAIASIIDESKTNVVRLDISSLSEAHTILYSAYRNEPTFQYLFEHSRSGYEQRVKATVKELVRQHFEAKQDVIGLALDNDLIGVALIGSPELRLGLGRQLGWQARMILTAGVDCTWRYLAYHKRVSKVLPPNNHHQLPLLGIHADYQNRGFGRQLMHAVERVCKDNPRSAGIALDTGNMRYLKFYQGMGYQLVGHVQLGELKESVLFKPRDKF